MTEFYGGHPFLKGMVSEIKNRNPGMMSLIVIAISVAYLYSFAVVIGLPGKFFFWQPGVLIGYGILPTPAAEAVLMSLSTVIVFLNAKSLKIE